MMDVESLRRREVRRRRKKFEADRPKRRLSLVDEVLRDGADSNPRSRPSMGSILRRESAENAENESWCVDAAADAAVDARLGESSEFDVRRNTFVSHDQGNRQRSTQFFLRHNSQRS